VNCILLHFEVDMLHPVTTASTGFCDLNMNVACAISSQNYGHMLQLTHPVADASSSPLFPLGYSTV